MPNNSIFSKTSTIYNKNSTYIHNSLNILNKTNTMSNKNTEKITIISQYSSVLEKVVDILHNQAILAKKRKEVRVVCP